MNWNKALFTAFAVAAGSLALAGQEQRPKNVPFYTWVREDTFAGFMADDMVRFERGMQKTQEYIKEDPNNMAAVNWLGAGTMYRAVRAFDAGDAAKGDQLFSEAVAMIDKASAAAPDDVGIHATAGGTLILFASRLPERHYRTAVEKARDHYAVVYKAQEAMIDKFPLHLKGEALAGIAEAEFRLGNLEAANTYLRKIATGMPGTRYAQIADTWIKSPESVTKKDRLACQSCHEAGRLSSWMKSQPQADGFTR
jgi:tetratricopeptide (TPR) repeat protein